jgi:hypothetical protein
VAASPSQSTLIPFITCSMSAEPGRRCNTTSRHVCARALDLLSTPPALARGRKRYCESWRALSFLALSRSRSLAKSTAGQMLQRKIAERQRKKDLQMQQAMQQKFNQAVLRLLFFKL